MTVAVLEGRPRYYYDYWEEMSLVTVMSIIESDAFLACFVALAVLLVGFKLFSTGALALSEIRDLISPRQRNSSRNSYFSLERAYQSYLQYSRLSAYELSLMQASYRTLHRSNKNLGYDIGYPKKLDRLRHVTNLNATITDVIVQLAREEFPSVAYQSTHNMVSADLGRVRESLKHFIRDWSEEGARERTHTFSPILDVLKEVDPSQRAGTKVLVPGCGLGRLAWEIAQLEFDTTANEISFFMTLALRFLFSPKTTNSVNQHSLHPYAYWFSHQKSNESLFRGVSFPDVIPRFTPNFHLVERDFMSLPIPSTQRSDKPVLTWSTEQLIPPSSDGYDFIVTLFFIDASLDVFATMRRIYQLLRPGGSWINLGPLRWIGGAQAKVELSLDEVLLAAEEIGFILQKGVTGTTARKTMECEYTSDPNAMMRWIYTAEFWVAKKPVQ